MSELKISDFKMLEKAPYTKPLPKNSIELIIKGSIEQEKTYGPIFSDLYIKHALRFAAKKYGETPKEAIKTLDQLIEYLVSVSDKHPDAANAAVYAGLKAESDIQGKSGAGIRVGLIGFFRSLGKKPSAKERNVDIDQLLATFQKTLIQLGLAHYEVGYNKNEDGSVNVIWPNCYIKDGCRLASDEGATKRIIGGLQCVSCSGMCQILKLLSSYDWDYELLEFDKPHCIARSFMI
ncbi:MAG: hypothetical protein WED07_14850 [Candidatus Freyarchaeum deiterrae]